MCLHLNLNTKLIDEDGVLDKRVIIFEDALLYLKQIVIAKNSSIASPLLRRQQILIPTEINNSGM